MDQNNNGYQLMDLSKALQEGISIIAQGYDKEDEQKTVTVQAEVVGILDKGKKYYRVLYDTETFVAVSINENYSYQVGEIVYVIVPKGDFSQNLVIFAPVYPEGVTLASTEEEQLFIPFGSNLFFNGSSGLELSTWIDDKVSMTMVAAENKPIFEKTFNSALDDTRTFTLSCRIRTDIASNRRTQGNYGLNLTLPLLQQGIPVTYTVTLDINGIKGDAYNFSSPALQNYYFTIPENSIYDISRNIEFEGFTTNFISSWDVETDGEPPKDIFFTDIQLIPILLVDKQTKAGYFMKISPSKGPNFLSLDDTSKVLTPILYLDGKETVADSQGYDCYWFRENGLVDYTHAGYHQYGGIGWEILNEKITNAVTEDGKESFTYITDQFTYTINQSDIYTDLRFKCVLVEKGGNNTNVIDIITIRNLISAKALLSLTTSGGSVHYVPNAKKATLIMDYKELDYTYKVVIDEEGNESIVYKDLQGTTINYKWQRYDQYGNICIDDSFYIVTEDYICEQDGKGGYEQHVDIPIEKINGSMTVSCTVYLRIPHEETIINEDDEEEVVKTFLEKVIGTKSIILYTDAEPTYRIEVNNGDKFFKYDGMGNSPMTNTLLTENTYTILPVYIQLVKPDGTYFTEDDYAITTVTWWVPKNSLITLNEDSENIDKDSDSDYYILTGDYENFKELHYSIANVYSKTKNNNIIKVSATYSDVVMNTQIPFTFTKDGESGTNGTDYSAAIVYGAGDNQYAYGGIDPDGKMHKLQLIYVGSDFGLQDQGHWFIYKTDKVDEGTNKGIYHIGSAVTIGGVTYPGAGSDDLSFSIKMYCEGNPVIFDGNFILETSWSIYDEEVADYDNIISPITIAAREDLSGQISIRTVDKQNNPIDWSQIDFNTYNVCATIQARCKAKRSQQDLSLIKEREYYVFAYYPIEVTYVGTIDYLKEYVPSITGGFTDVVFSGAGFDPQYDSSEDFEVYDALKSFPIIEVGDQEVELDVTSFRWSTSDNLRIVEKEKIPAGQTYISSPSKKIIPNSVFNGDHNKNYVKVKLEYASDQTEELEAEILKYEGILHEIAQKRDEINAYYNEENLSIFKAYDSVYDEIIDIIKMGNDNLKRKNDFTLNLTTLLQRATEIVSALNSLPGTNPDPAAQAKEISIQDVLAIEDMIQSVDTLGTLTTQIQIDSLYNKIKTTIFPNVPLIDTRISEVPKEVRQKYPSINDIIKRFNDFLNGTYNPFVTKLTREELGNTNTLISEISTTLHQYITRQEWINLTTEDAFDAKKFTDLYNQIDTYVSYISDAKYNKNFSLITTEILNPIKEVLKPYYNCSYNSKLIAFTLLYGKNKAILEQLESSLYNIVGVTKITHCRPVIILFNRNECGFLSDWDGNKLIIDEDKGYITAPVFGAGIKNNDNTFTGITMGVLESGKDQVIYNNNSSKIGIFGHSNGKQSFFLNAKDGSAFFGCSGEGRIYIDPDPNQGGGLLYNQSFFKNYDENGKPTSYDSSNWNYSGMLIDLRKSNIHLGDARTDKVTGEEYGIITSGQHTKIDSTAQGFYLSHRGLSIGAGVRIDSNGNFRFGNLNDDTKAIIYDVSTKNIAFGSAIKVTMGDLIAKTINNGAFQVTPQGVVTMSRGSINLANNFIVTDSGTVTIKNGSINLGNNGFTANSDGYIQVLKGGKIGEWTIDTQGIMHGKKDSTYNSDIIRLDPDSGLISFLDKVGRRTFFGSHYNADNTLTVYAKTDKTAAKGNFYAQRLYSKGAVFIGLTDNDLKEEGETGVAVKTEGVIRIRTDGIAISYKKSKNVYDWKLTPWSKIITT